MTRRWFAAFSFAAVLAAQEQKKPQEKPPEQEPPEEDESLKPKAEYTFNPIQAESEYKVGKFYQKQGKFKSAAMRFEEATRWNPTYAEAFLGLGECLEKLNDSKKSRAAYEKYLELAPDAKNATAIRKKINGKS